MIKWHKDILITDMWPKFLPDFVAAHMLTDLLVLGGEVESYEGGTPS